MPPLGVKTLLWAKRVVAVLLVCISTPLLAQGTPANTRVNLCIDPDWPPYEWLDAQGQYHGIGADLVREIGRLAHVDFQVIRTRNWPESLAAARNGECQALAFLNRTPERAEWLEFTEPFFKDANVFITRQDFDYIVDPTGLAGTRLVLPAGTGLEEHMRRRFPNLTYLNVESEAAALRAVQQGDADMTIRSLAVAAWTLRNEGLFSLKISGELTTFSNELRMGFTHGQSALVQRLNTAIGQISPEMVQHAVNKHVPIQAFRGIDYRKQYLPVSIALLVVVSTLFWVFRLRRLNRRLREREAELAKSRHLLQQAMEEEYQANLEQHQFMRMVAHEFRTPLSVMTSSADLLELKLQNQATDTNNLRSTITRQREATRYLTELVNRALDADRSMQAAWQRNAAWVSCDTLLSQVSDYVKVLDQGTHLVTIENHADQIPGDLDLLTRMMNNLVENALKYSPAGGTVVVKACQDDTRVYLTVSDDGPGIAPEQQPTIFGKYQRGEHADTPGLGLGLYLVRRIVQLHNGDITLDSAPGKGTRFTVSLPKDHNEKPLSDQPSGPVHNDKKSIDA